MEIVRATEELAGSHADEIADLVYATGTSSFDYQFGDRRLFNAMVEAAWETPQTLFGFDAATLAIDGRELLGLEIGFPGQDFVDRRKRLDPVCQRLVEAGTVRQDELDGLDERARHARYLVPVTHSASYYVLTLSVKPEHRGRQVGARLLRNAMRRARRASLAELLLDVQSDYPAVGFYRSLGLECVAETVAPVPLAHGVPMQMRMAIGLDGAD